MDDFDHFDPEADAPSEYVYDTCPSCGGRKQSRSKLCRVCWMQTRADDKNWRGSKRWKEIKN
jgi:hypothetical protein